LAWALDYLRYYLLGREFKLEIDHEDLQSLEKMKDTNRRITLWSLAFQFTVNHVPGKSNVTADYFSHCICAIYGLLVYICKYVCVCVCVCVCVANIAVYLEYIYESIEQK